MEPIESPEFDVKPGSVWRTPRTIHGGGQATCKVIGVAEHTETGEAFVVYITGGMMGRRSADTLSLFREVWGYVGQGEPVPMHVSQPPRGGDLWRHVRTTNVYQVVTEAWTLAAAEGIEPPLVIYRRYAKGADPDEKLWARPKDMFYDGRFVRLGEAPVT